MKRLQILIVILAISQPGNADQASAAYKRGSRAEEHNKYDEAYQAYNEAHSLKPKDAKYFAAFVRLRFYASMEHVRAGQSLRDAGKVPEALKEFQRGAEIDHTNFVASGEARRTAETISKQAQRESQLKTEPTSPLAKLAEDAAGPVELQPTSNTLINLRIYENTTAVYKIIGKLAGINVLFDPDYRPQKINIELNDVTLREALQMVALQSKTFWQATSTNTIFVAADNPGKRKEIQNTVMKTFYLRNISSTSELQEAANTLKAILDLNRLQLIPAQNAMILRGTPDQMVLAEKLLTDIDKPKPEVVVDIAVMQVSRDRIRQLGSTPPTSTNLTLQSTPTSSGGSGGNQFLLNSLASLGASNLLLTIPGDTFTALMSDSNTKLLQNPEIRVLDNAKATLKIGDRVPVATGSFGAASGGGGVSALVNTQFQYLDVGVNIDITPHIHSEREVTLKLVLEVSSISGTEDIGGITQPIIGQRRIEHETRLQDGEVNLVGGILEDTETQSLSGYPWLAKIPILRYFFAQENKEKQENEIVFAITPHIVRALDLTEQNLRLVDLGPGSGVSVRHTDPRKVAPATGPAPSGASPLPSGRLRTPDPAPSTSQNPASTPNITATPTRNGLSAPAKSWSQSSPQNTPPGAAPSAAKGEVNPCPDGHHAIRQENGAAACALN